MQKKDKENRSIKEQLISNKSEMNDVLEVMKIAKSNYGRVAKERTILNEQRI